MPLASQETVDKLRADLVDPDAVAWTDDDLLECVNEAIRAVVQVKPDAYTLNDYIPVVAGTNQVIPGNGIALFDIFENEVSARRVTQVDQELLDEVSRFWPAGVRETDVKHFCFDPRDKKGWRCYPPNDGTGSVYATYGAVPSPMSFSDVLPLGDEYEPAIFARALAAAYRRNTLRQDLAKTQGYMQQFLTMLGLSAQGQAAVAPRVDGGG